ncbi:hypothetical protein JTB14_016713 [Gonioctena quinquepunctata]|nr:hypothetical protein JTB14_016713 [Gonioctena quinquepunctata]
MRSIETTAGKTVLNYRDKEVKRVVFEADSSTKLPTSSKKIRKLADSPTTSKTAATEIWMCSVCDNVACVSCGAWEHEEYVGLSKEHTEDFTSPECMP